jgi:hypothetical protein
MTADSGLDATLDMVKMLLVGAGFSSNWGGPLASQVFNWLLASPEISGDSDLKRCLWDHQNAGGFENALAQVQSEFLMSPSARNKERLERFQLAINNMFAVMERGFSARATWEFLPPTEDRARSLLHFLVQFDVIFTLKPGPAFRALLPRPNGPGGACIGPTVERRRHPRHARIARPLASLRSYPVALDTGAKRT